MSLVLYGTPTCPYTAEMREELEWQGRDFVEYDVEQDAAARQDMLRLTDGNRTVPVLVEDGKLVSIGFRGRGCYVGDR
jgi:glutaredoxin